MNTLRSFFILALLLTLPLPEFAAGSSGADAARTGAQSAGPEAIRRLIARLADGDWEKAVEDLRAVGEPAVAPLIAALEGEERWISSRASHALVAIGTPEALEAVYAAARSPDYPVQAGAVLALRTVKNDRAVEVLIEVLRSGQAKMFAANALGESDSAQAIEPLVEALADRDKFVRGAAAQALGRLKSGQAVPGLVRCLEDPEGFVRQHAREALVAIGASAHARLEASLTKVRPMVRWQLIWALRKMEGIEAWETLVPLLDDPDWRVRNEAAIALSRAPSPMMKTRLRPLLSGSNCWSHAEVRWILEQPRASAQEPPEDREPARPEFSHDLPVVERAVVRQYPETVDARPNLPSPFRTPDGREWVVTRTKDDRFAVVPVTLVNGKRPGRQLWINAGDFPALAKRGLHNPDELARTHMITGRSLAEVTELAQPGGLSDSGFLAADEDILSVLQGDNRLVKALGLTHPDLARPLFHVWNLILTDFDLKRWNMREHQWENMPELFYGQRKIHLAAGDTKGGQLSVFDDGLEGAFWINIDTDLTADEEAFLRQRYPHLDSVTGELLRQRLTRITTGEMEAYYIMGYGFYEGHTEWRTDPIAIAFVFGLRSLEAIEAAFPGQLDRVLQSHFIRDVAPAPKFSLPAGGGFRTVPPTRGQTRTPEAHAASRARPSTRQFGSP